MTPKNEQKAAPAKKPDTRTSGEKAVDIAADVVDRLFIYFFVLILLFCGYAIYDSLMVYREAELPTKVAEYAKKDERQLTTEVDFNSLRAINNEIVGWVQLNDTKVDFPITHTDNNSYYLTRSYTREYSLAGSIYLDARNNGNFTDDYSVIYGHNMNDEMMFGGLKEFDDAAFFATHQKGKLFTPDKTYELEVLAYIKTDKMDQVVYDVPFIRNGKNSFILQHAAEKSTNQRNLDTRKHLLALSTCHGHDGERVVLLTAFGDEISTPESESDN